MIETTLRSTNTHQSGFTLLELSIVLVIVGLLLGGIFLSRELIESARAKATISQIIKYNAAANAFQSKYGYLPGDLPSRTAIQYGFATRTGAPGRGDGDNLIEASAAGNYTVACSETILFWTDLSGASLIDGTFKGADGYSPGGTCTTAGTGSTLPLNQLIPEAKLGNGNYISVYSQGGNNYYQITGGVTKIDGAGYFINGAAGMSAQAAYNIDAKMDDGYPNTGTVMSVAALDGVHFTFQGAGTSGAPATGICANNTVTPNSYNLASAYANGPACSLAIQFQ